jgi:hypothetical protein
MGCFPPLFSTIHLTPYGLPCWLPYTLAPRFTPTGLIYHMVLLLHVLVPVTRLHLMFQILFLLHSDLVGYGPSPSVLGESGQESAPEWARSAINRNSRWRGCGVNTEVLDRVGPGSVASVWAAN